MNNSNKSETNVWIISGGKYVHPRLAGIKEDITVNPVMEYSISQLAMYLLNPNQIEIKKRLVGCRITYKESRTCRFKKKLGKILPKNLKKIIKADDAQHEILLSDDASNLPAVDDKELGSHLKTVEDLLSSHNPIRMRMSALDINSISDIAGICDDYGGNRSILHVQGKLEEKIKYISNFILKDVGVILARAYLAKGLFEMRGFNFKSYDSKKYYRLIKVAGNDKGKYVVLDTNGNIEYWINDETLVQRLHLLEQSIRTDYKFRESLEECIKGKAKPLKIFFNKKLEIDYSKEDVPLVYRNILKDHDIKLDEKKKVADSLKHQQLGIAFNSVPVAKTGAKKLCTSISVMHNIQALEQIKNDLPWLYSKIEEKVSFSEAGKFYLLDSIKGFQNG
ncbi:MAG: hypothetical protein JJV89_06040 [Desulfosarcina sp.]|nr:hypothetical protein [Desulfobacterales bacterium]